MAALPASPTAGRRAHFRHALRSRASFWTLFTGVGGSLLLAAAWHDPLVAIGGPAATFALVLAIAYTGAKGRAEREFFLALAPALGMSYIGELGTWGVTPLLAAGDRRRFEHVIGREGCHLGLYTYEVRRKAPRNETVRWEPYDFTVCVLDLAPQMPAYPGVYVRRRQGLVHGHDWLRDQRFREVDVESIAFEERYDVLCAPDQDELALRELLSPALIDWMANHPLQPGFELRGGVLVAWLPGHEMESGKLEFFLQAAEHLSAAAGRELAEHATLA